MGPSESVEMVTGLCDHQRLQGWMAKKENPKENSLRWPYGGGIGGPMHQATFPRVGDPLIEAIADAVYSSAAIQDDCQRLINLRVESERTVTSRITVSSSATREISLAVSS